MEEKKEKLSLYELTERQQAIEDALIDNGGELTPELEALMEDTAEKMDDKIDGYRFIIRRLEAKAAAFKAEKERHATAQRVCENSVKRIKEHLTNTMIALGVKKYETQTTTVLLRSSKSVNYIDTILDEYAEKVQKFQDSLPSWIKCEISVSKTELKAALEKGEVPGAMFEENNSVQIK